jgi:hypothetical protein
MGVCIIRPRVSVCGHAHEGLFNGTATEMTLALRTTSISKLAIGCIRAASRCSGPYCPAGRDASAEIHAQLQPRPALPPTESQSEIPVVLCKVCISYSSVARADAGIPSTPQFFESRPATCSVPPIAKRAALLHARGLLAGARATGEWRAGRPSSPSSPDPPRAQQPPSTPSGASLTPSAAAPAGSRPPGGAGAGGAAVANRCAACPPNHAAQLPLLPSTPPQPPPRRLAATPHRPCGVGSRSTAAAAAAAAGGCALLCLGNRGRGRGAGVGGGRGGFTRLG